MSLILDRLPQSVMIVGKPIPIDTDFRAGIRFEQAILSGSSDAKALMEIYINPLPDGWQQAVEQILQFYRCGDADSEPRSSDWGKTKGRAYDFAQDEDALYASFWQTYGIDLAEVKMHWWKFRRLMFGLPPECRFMQIVHYRTVDLNEVPKGQKRYYEKYKKRFAIHDENIDRKLTLFERNQKMKDYVNRRYETCKK